MGWTTLYIKGKSGFETEVLKHLDQSDVPFMPGSAYGEHNVFLFWVDEDTSIRDFKKAIGSKTIFKYRLRVYTSLESLNIVHNEAQNNSLTPQEEDMVRSMKDWQVNQLHYKHSA